MVGPEPSVFFCTRLPTGNVCWLRSMFYVFVIVIAALGIAIYLTVVLRAVPGAVDERLGRLEDLPPHLGEWTQDANSEHAVSAKEQGLVRETRILLEPAQGLFGREQLVEQARYREAESGKIIRVDPERRSARRRLKV